MFDDARNGLALIKSPVRRTTEKAILPGDLRRSTPLFGAASFRLSLQRQQKRDATTRGIGLAKGAPEPSIIRMNASSDTGILITVLEMSHG